MFQSVSNCVCTTVVAPASKTSAPTSRFFVSDVDEKFSEPTNTTPSATSSFACR